MNNYKIEFTNLIKKQMKLMQKRGKDMSKLHEVLDILVKGEKLPEQYRDHQLLGQFKNFRECHIEPDWLLVYKLIEKQLVLLLIRTGSHSDLFK